MEIATKRMGDFLKATTLNAEAVGFPNVRPHYALVKGHTAFPERAPHAAPGVGMPV